ncbi:unnamed protein product [Effrenium voratum]|nr:unnamed protein product [Effrenium voratum]
MRCIQALAVLALANQVLCQQSDPGDPNCPCSVGQESELCTQCQRTRCSIGGSALSNWLKEDWGHKAGEMWTKSCQKLMCAGCSTSATCFAAGDPCVEACEGQSADCYSKCIQALPRAGHACATFPWPTPLKPASIMQHLPDVFT